MLGIQRHFFATGLGALFGYKVDQWTSSYYADRDAVLRHYIELHPEDFQITSKFIDILILQTEN